VKNGDRLRLLALGASVVGFAACAVVVLLSFIRAVPPSPPALWVVLFIGIFPLHLRSVVVHKRNADRPPGSKIRIRKKRGRITAPERVPSRTEGSTATSLLYLAVGLVIILAAVAFLSARSSLGGGATTVNGSYFLNDHGELIPVSYHAYERALAAEGRVFTSIPAAFYAVGIAFNASPAERN
jgi:hypothetical protein